MAYVRKTRDVHTVQMHTAEGWEDVTASYVRREALDDLKVYRKNDPHNNYRMTRKREKIG